MFFLGAPMICWLRQKRWKKDVVSDAEAWQVREDTPETHQKKQGTPSMGGLGIIAVACAVFLALIGTTLGFYGGISSRPIWLHLMVWCWLPIIVAAHAALGFADDWSKASGRGGLRARAKLLGQISLGLLFTIGFIVTLRGSLSGSFGQTWLYSPLLNFSDPLRIVGLVGVLILVLVATGNAVNLTDGIDGLAAGLAVQFAFVLALLNIPEKEIAIVAIWFWSALAGSCLGFLSYNKYPAKVFMGDTGSLALGAAVGGAAIMTHSVFLLPFIAFIYFVEMFSVTLQVLYFKYTKKKYGEGRRIFRRAPLHHHFELGGWSEWRVVGTFWAINLVTSIIGLILWHLQILPRFP